MTYEEKKMKLRRYLLHVDMLKARCREAELWQPFALPGGIAGAGRQRHAQREGLDGIAATAETIQQEVEQLAGRVNVLRRELTDSIALMPTERYRTVLDLIYISGATMAEASLRMGYAPGYCRRLLRRAITELGESSGYFEG